jgi:hypothetical protein
MSPVDSKESQVKLSSCYSLHDSNAHDFVKGSKKRYDSKLGYDPDFRFVTCDKEMYYAKTFYYIHKYNDLIENSSKTASNLSEKHGINLNVHQTDSTTTNNYNKYVDKLKVDRKRSKINKTNKCQQIT